MKKTLFTLLAVYCTLTGFAAVKAPSNITVTPLSTTSIEIKWTNNESGAKMLIERSHNGSNYVTVAEVNSDVSSYTDEGLGIGAVCGYRLRATSGTEKSTAVLSDIITTKNKRFSYNLAAMPQKTTKVQFDDHDRPAEKSPSAFDNDYTSKYLFRKNNGWMMVRLDKAHTAQAYTLVSANDAPDRDPKTWTLQGANNETGPWTLLDSRENIQFCSRFTPLTFKIEDTTPYQFYRLTISANNGNGSMTQLAEFQVWGERDAEEIAAEKVAAPSGLKATVMAHHLANLEWKDNSNNEEFFRIQRSTDGIDWSEYEWTASMNSTKRYAPELKGNTTYYFRVRAENRHSVSDWATLSNPITTPDSTVPETITERWFEHNQTVKRVYLGEHVAVYFDNEVNPTITWPFEVFNTFWAYVKDIYGPYSDPMLYVLFHAEKYSGGHPSGFTNEAHYYYNMIDNGTNESGSTAWTSVYDYGIPVHEISHIMEGCSWHMDGSPERRCWGDSKFAEIFMYDFLVKMSSLDGDPYGFKPVLEKELPLFLKNNESDGIPKPGCYWFRDFYLPMYENYGGSEMLAKFFRLMYEYWPKKDNSYEGEMNYGEFFHFYSGACNTDITNYADKAFGMTSEYKYQFRYAQIAYPMPYCMSNDETGIIEIGKGSKEEFPSILNGELSIYDYTGKKVLLRNCVNENWQALIQSLNLTIHAPYICLLTKTNGQQVSRKIILQ